MLAIICRYRNLTDAHNWWIKEIIQRQHSQPPLNGGASNHIVRSNMNCSEVIALLTRRGCIDLTYSLIPPNHVTYPVASGGLGDVFCGQLVDGTPVAIKTIRVYGGDSHGKYNKRAAREIHTWSKFSHPNIVKLLGLAVYRDCLAMVSPWASNGDLRRYLYRHQSADRCRLSISICAGLAYLHENKVVHGDLKGANVLIAGDGTPMLADFGSSSLRDTTLQFTRTDTQPGYSLRWTAPEIIRGKSGNTTAGDVYSLGMVS
ncbi:Calmodulin-binding receptor-like cytoplasmic kinase 1 OS=Arabidopsis thaliana GN=CRCK1 PE=1 SV=1 [Rhizoctonia solani AG-1 IB]|uniref:Calmodulin-binding receptor-like cytoplasmic kinase 1 n=1 Tax=Thanatephorus cucumeris (strain AG1-IB / isolate 7/3/14) TaxID=1108050 RepID=A0A0B7FM08_THACB|nr:Calmodulin-binding receptor-like cytoplasmic kinase 1 OS=Arabidopsis thaliana GN=CRCK1 PE=1 SV=1 [Rhizoctonia solani AG-1 IB]